MEKQDIKEFTDIMLAIADNYPGATFTSAGLKLRFEALKEFSIDQVSEAAVKLIRDHKYNTMPTTADIIDAMDGRISVKDRAEIEAGKIIAHLRLYGKAVIPEFEDPITQHLMATRWRYGSWAAYVVDADLKWWFRDFVRAYQAHAAGIGMACLPNLAELKRLAGQIGTFGKESIYA